MPRHVFYSFNYRADNWRVSKVKQIGAVEGQRLLNSNDWEKVEKGGDVAIKKWIDEQMAGKSCLVVLIGRSTAGRKWVNYEIEKAWNDGKGVLGVHIHNITDSDGKQSTKGANPFSGFTLNGGEALTKYAKAYDPAGVMSSTVYNNIKDNLGDWIEEAIRLRKLANNAPK